LSVSLHKVPTSKSIIPSCLYFGPFLDVIQYICACVGTQSAFDHETVHRRVKISMAISFEIKLMMKIDKIKITGSHNSTSVEFVIVFGI
jgi:hypothetical protein